MTGARRRCFAPQRRGGHGRAIVTIVLVTGAAAQGHVPPAASVLADQPFTGVFVDAPDRHGVVWARGARYKAALSTAGVPFYPLLGADQPQRPLAVRLAGVERGRVRIVPGPGAALRQHGQVVEIDHGELVEHWDLTPGFAEQSFEFAQVRGAGDLVVRIAIDTDLVPVGENEGDALCWVAGERGGVRYANAVAIDATGSRARLALRRRGGQVELRVPADFVDAAAMPLVVDPIVQTFGIDTTVGDVSDPDVAYDATHDVWLMAYEKEIGTGDQRRQVPPAASGASRAASTATEPLRPRIFAPRQDSFRQPPAGFASPPGRRGSKDAAPGLGAARSPRLLRRRRPRGASPSSVAAPPR